MDLFAFTSLPMSTNQMNPRGVAQCVPWTLHCVCLISISKCGPNEMQCLIYIPEICTLMPCI